MFHNKINQYNVWCFFGITLSIYFPQGLFFVGISAYFSTFDHPLIPLGNAFLLAMVPFIISAFFLAQNIDKVLTKTQLIILKGIRSLVLFLLGLGIIFGRNPSTLIYIAIIFYDLGFFLYQNISAKIAKHISLTDCLKRIESINLLATQLGMATGGMIAGFLLGTWSLGGVLLLASSFEFLGCIGVLLYDEGKLAHIANNSVKIEKDTAYVFNFFGIILKILKFPETVFAIISFSLILPLQQLLNLISGPWAEIKFHDSGKMLSWLVFGVALGACFSSILLIFYAKFRDAKWLKFSPLLIVISVVGIYYSFNLSTTLSFSILFGCSFTLSRMVIRSSFIESIDIQSINGAAMVATMLGIIFSVIAIVLLSYVFTMVISRVFIIIASLAFIQLLLLLSATRILRKT